jgi:hypothetical protein
MWWVGRRVEVGGKQTDRQRETYRFSSTKIESLGAYRRDHPKFKSSSRACASITPKTKMTAKQTPRTKTTTTSTHPTSNQPSSQKAYLQLGSISYIFAFKANLGGSEHVALRIEIQ